MHDVKEPYAVQTLLEIAKHRLSMALQSTPINSVHVQDALFIVTKAAEAAKKEKMI